MIRIGENFDLKYVEGKIGKYTECIFKEGKKKETRGGIVERVKNTLSLHIDESFYDWYIILYNYKTKQFNPNLYDII